MTTIDVLKTLARIDQMLSLRDEAQKAGDPESLLVVKMMDHAVTDARNRLRDALPLNRFAELRRQYLGLVAV